MPQDFLPFAKPSIDQKTIDEVVDCLNSGWLATGPRVKQFTTNLKDYLHANYVLPLTSGTAALHLSLAALNLQQGDEVITCPMTFVATANTIVIAGAKPVFVDAQMDSYNIDVSKIEKAITKKTKAIIPIHYAGLPVDLDAIYDLAKKHRLRVIEDAAHAIGTEYQGKKIGSFGDTQIFSFHPNKNMTTGEGGCVTTNDDKMARFISIMRFHGIDRDAFNRFSKEGSQHYDVIAPGFKYNMMDLQAAIGIHQLQHLDTFIEKRTKLAHRYLDLLADWPEFTLPKITALGDKHAWHLFVPLINPEKSQMSRDEFIARMKEHDVGIGFHYDAVHSFSYYQKTLGYKKGDFPNTESIASRIVSLPLFYDMTIDEQDRVIDAMKKVFQ